MVEWIGVAFFVYRGQIVQVDAHSKAADRRLTVGDGSSDRPYRQLAPAVYVLPVPPAKLNAAAFYRNRVSFRDGDFYFHDGTPLWKMQRPLKPKRQLIPEITGPKDDEATVEWLN